MPKMGPLLPVVLLLRQCSCRRICVSFVQPVCTGQEPVVVDYQHDMENSLVGFISK
ncbi:hypothetical protein KP509_25G059400 [Ceratopteris richardii]|uniref:Uncharacterized protein n=1 Tax=Ceratopteris richardii TaxID=49495 RepID=A0A8T2RSQ1_CERRI|nr:hypothetical protein KP509_25G059400 [Ceratopteris richardii]